MDAEGTRTEKPGRALRRAVITGATGMLGATLGRRLLAEGCEVLAVIRPDSPKRMNLPERHPGLTVIPCSLRELADLRIPGEADAFFHFAWDGPYGAARNDPALQQGNVASTLDAVRAAASAGCQVFVTAGSQAVCGPVDRVITEHTPARPVTEYGKAKLEAEERGDVLAKSLGMDLIKTRILSVYGPYDNPYTLVMSAIRSMMTDDPIAFTKGEQVWDYLFSEDAAGFLEGLARTGRPGIPYVISSGTRRTLKEYLEAIRDAVNPHAVLNLGALPYFEHQAMFLAGDPSKTISDSGYAPRTDFREGILKTLAWLKQAREA
ncbi:MAG: NAD(P)-dependent oxidoreductase [Lachnospiraceae bacterium]|nr:NAD(P)-dependent oxidoreductase [Lachnospiraceae bacterium]